MIATATAATAMTRHALVSRRQNPKDKSQQQGSIDMGTTQERPIGDVCERLQCRGSLSFCAGIDERASTPLNFCFWPATARPSSFTRRSDERLREHPIRGDARLSRKPRISFERRHLCRSPTQYFGCHPSSESARSSLSAERFVGECLDDIHLGTCTYRDVYVRGSHEHMRAGMGARACFSLLPFWAQGD